VSLGSDFDEDQDCAVVAVSYFGGKTDVIEALNKLDELSFCLLLACGLLMVVARWVK
jgi:hypothetical protein